MKKAESSLELSGTVPVRGRKSAAFRHHVASGAVLLLALFALSAGAAESKSDKDARECRKAPPTMKSPADLKKAKRDAFNACMAGKGYATGNIRAK